MGYAIFTARKLLLQSRLNNANYQLMMLTQRQQNLAVQTANAQMMKDLTQSNGMLSLYTEQRKMFEDMANGQTVSDEQMNLMASKIKEQEQKNKVESAIYESQMASVKTLENQIELEKQKLETILQSTQTEMETVQKSEEANIKASTPKYGGAQ